MIFILFVDHEKINYNAWFFKSKGSTSNSSEVNVELPTTNVAIPILENVDVPIPENVDVPISQIQFQRIDLDSLDYSLLILYGCIFEIFFFAYLRPPRFKILRSAMVWDIEEQLLYIYKWKSLAEWEIWYGIPDCSKLWALPNCM